GFLSTSSGDKVQGLKGDIQINGNEFSVGEDGSIVVDGRAVDTLKIMAFPQENRLTKLGNSYWAPSSPEQKPFKPEFISVEQRVLESSNVDTVQEMVNMINVNRSYEAAQKLMRSMDDLDDQVISIAKI
ncbi:MAG: flagellar hook-basal body complex protein, partial [bacterium]